MKDKEKLRNCSGLKETKETWQWYGMWGPELDPRLGGVGWGGVQMVVGG